MDVVAIEQAFTSWVAGKLGMTVNTNIFRGGIPDGMDGATVLFNGEVKSAMIAPRAWNAQILSKFNDRDDAMRFLARLAGLFPCYDVSLPSITFKVISQRGSSTPYSSTDGGKTRWFVSFNVLLIVLTTGAQS